MKDLANMAGVLRQPVSRALAGSPLVNPRTRKDILRLARENGYKQLISAEPGRQQYALHCCAASARAFGLLDDAFFLELWAGLDRRRILMIAILSCRILSRHHG